MGDWNSDPRYIVDKSTVLFASFVLLHSIVIRANQVDELATSLVILTEVCESYGPDQLSLLAEYLEIVRREATFWDTEKVHLDVGLWIVLTLFGRHDKAAQIRKNIRAGLISLVEQDGYPKKSIMDQYSHVMHASTIEGYLGKLEWEEFDPFEIWNDSDYGGLKNGEH